MIAYKAALLVLCAVFGAASASLSFAQTNDGNQATGDRAAADETPSSPPQGNVQTISQNQALFALLGTTYGGDGQSTFALPTAKPIFTATEATLIQCIAVQGVFPSRS